MLIFNIIIFSFSSDKKFSHQLRSILFLAEVVDRETLEEKADRVSPQITIATICSNKMLRNN